MLMSLFVTLVDTIDREISPLKYFRPYAERRKLHARKIEMRIHVMLRNCQVFLTRKFKPRIIFNAKIFRSTVIPWS